MGQIIRSYQITWSIKFHNIQQTFIFHVAPTVQFWAADAHHAEYVKNVENNLFGHSPREWSGIFASLVYHPNLQMHHLTLRKMGL
jgi:hypothetical protein